MLVQREERLKKMCAFSELQEPLLTSGALFNCESLSAWKTQQSEAQAKLTLTAQPRRRDV